MEAYGILLQTSAPHAIARAAEELTVLGYTLVDSGFSRETILEYAERFDEAHARYLSLYGSERLQRVDEANGIRLPMALDRSFLTLAMNPGVLELLKTLISGRYILNQQNGIINPPGASYNQGSWHRDLPYQHFVSSRPLAINTLYCVDDFTLENGATQVLPASHRQEAFPSPSFVEQQARTITAPAGSFLVLDAMTFHRGSYNRSSQRRRAVNHLYTIPFFKQQICIRNVLPAEGLSENERDLLGFRYQPAASVTDFLLEREQR